MNIDFLIRIFDQKQFIPIQIQIIRDKMSRVKMRDNNDIGQFSKKLQPFPMLSENPLLGWMGRQLISTLIDRDAGID